EDCDAVFFKGGSGVSVNLWNKGPLGYFLVEGAVESSPRFETERLTTSVGPTLGLRAQVKPWISVLLEGRYLRNINLPVFEDRQLDAHLRLYPKSQQVAWAFDASAAFKRASREVSVGLVHYF
ncbi:MAG: hypothetical protein AAB250_12570, partial [Bdellovibrionota bacterium]